LFVAQAEEKIFFFFFLFVCSGDRREDCFRVGLGPKFYFEKKLDLQRPQNKFI